MRLIEAVWEQRNLGVTCAEANVDAADLAEDVIRQLLARPEQYLVVRVPHSRPDLLLSLQQNGFTYIETMLQTEITMKQPVPMPAKCEGLRKYIRWRTADAEETAAIIETVRAGNIFSTDRIALDPYFSPALAGRRYAFWLEDLAAAGKTAFLLSQYDGRDIGFNAVTDKGSYFDGVLGGLFPEYLGSGLGFANAYCSYAGSYDLGARRMISHVSANNFSMLQLHLMFGMRVTDVKSCLIRHNA